MKVTWVGAALLVAATFGCDDTRFDFDDPARGPGDLVGKGDKVSDAAFFGGDDVLPQPRIVAEFPDDAALPDCGPQCEAYCQSLGLTNPVNAGMCKSLWGVGLAHQPVVKVESCRRIHVDMLGRYPTREDIINNCDGKSWGEVAIGLINSKEFVSVNQRRWADKLLYDTQAVSVERIYDMDKLVGKLYEGRVAYDEFAAVVSAHPVLTRRFDTPEDRADALFWTFLGRPPLGPELADMSRLYTLWYNDYYDHPDLGMRLPDAHIRYRCIDENGDPDPTTRAECTSILFGQNELILKPDIRAMQNDRDERTMWSGVIKAEEWEKLQLPGRLIAGMPTFWEKLVDDVLMQYLGYDLGNLVPTVRDELVRYVLAYNGDIRALHFAVVTSAAYLQSASQQTQTDYRWTYGPLRQVDSEVWIDSIKHMTGYQIATCDHKLTRPQDFWEAGSIAGIALVENSNWTVQDEGVDYSYRNVARGLGGCPDNSVGGRFQIISILTTAQQLNFVNQVCDPAAEGGGAPIENFLPRDVDPNQSLTPELGEEIYAHQAAQFMGRLIDEEEAAKAREYAELCSGCNAAQFARPTCFAMLSSAEMLFY